MASLKEQIFIRLYYEYDGDTQAAASALNMTPEDFIIELGREMSLVGVAIRDAVRETGVSEPFPFDDEVSETSGEAK